jgi:muconolactone delta-isomerase
LDAPILHVVSWRGNNGTGIITGGNGAFWQGNVEFLVEFELEAPDGAADPGVAFEAEVTLAASTLADEGRLLRLWFVPNGLYEDKVLGLYRVEDVDELDDILDNLPLHEWVNVVITRLDPHPNDPYR